MNAIQFQQNVQHLLNTALQSGTTPAEAVMVLEMSKLDVYASMRKVHEENKSRIVAAKFPLPVSPSSGSGK